MITCQKGNWILFYNIVYTENDDKTPKTFEMIEWKSWFFSDMTPVTGYGSDFPETDDDTVILMQFTGLKDVEGVDIYEGDLLEEEKGYLFEVVWDAKYAKFKLQWRTKATQYSE